MAEIREIVLGTQSDKPALILRSVQASGIAASDVDKREPIWRALAALQALPDALIAAQVHSSRLMEVLIHGDLIPAADSIGFRAFAIGDRGIVEQAKLLNPNNLTALVDGALLWRFASIVVAQKHLADISRRLANIEKGISAIIQFQGDEQKSKIVGSLDYLRQVNGALTAGERSEGVKTMLEHIDRDMGGIQRHIEESFHRRLGEPIKGDYRGYKSLSSGFQKKLDDLEESLKTHQLAGRTRVAALSVLATYPGENALKSARSAAIMESVKRCKEMVDHAESDLYSQTECWSGTNERIENDALRRGKKVLRTPQRLYEAVTGREIFPDKDDAGSLTPKLDAAKEMARAKAHKLADMEREAADELAKACFLTDRTVLEAATPVRFLVEWGQGRPLSVRRAVK